MAAGHALHHVAAMILMCESGDLGQYMGSLRRLRDEKPTRIYPAHGPCIEDGVAKIQEYIDHRLARNDQILAAMKAGAREVPAIVAIAYAAYPKALHAAAGQSVTSHLLSLEREGRVAREAGGTSPTAARWTLAG